MSKIQEDLSRRILRNWLFALLVTLCIGGLAGYALTQSWVWAVVGAFVGGLIIAFAWAFGYFAREGIV